MTLQQQVDAEVEIEDSDEFVTDEVDTIEEDIVEDDIEEEEAAVEEDLDVEIDLDLREELVTEKPEEAPTPSPVPVAPIEAPLGLVGQVHKFVMDNLIMVAGGLMVIIGALCFWYVVNVQLVTQSSVRVM